MNKKITTLMYIFNIILIFSYHILMNAIYYNMRTDNTKIIFFGFVVNELFLLDMILVCFILVNTILILTLVK